MGSVRQNPAMRLSPSLTILRLHDPSPNRGVDSQIDRAWIDRSDRRPADVDRSTDFVIWGAFHSRLWSTMVDYGHEVVLSIHRGSEL